VVLCMVSQPLYSSTLPWVLSVSPALQGMVFRGAPWEARVGDGASTR